MSRFALVSVALACSVTGDAFAKDSGTAGALIAAYPDALERVDGADLVWRDGTRMRIDDGAGPKSAAARLAGPDLKDMLIEPYPAGAAISAPPRDADPGRARNGAFFNKLYGDCTTGEVTASLVEVVWLPRKYGRILKVNGRHGMAERLRAVSARLDALPAAFNAFLFPPAGTYNCRVIAGTDRVSTHGYAIAIDLAVKHAHYWRWAHTPAAGGTLPFQNAMPPEIISAFEAEGFIWGGRWYHYDTMHFEYRPELLPPP